MRKRNLLYMLALVLLVTVPVCVYLVYSSAENNADMAIRKLIAMPATATASDLERAGFINLSQIQDGRIGEVNSFFSQPVASKKTLLKTFSETENDIIARVFVKNNGAVLAMMTSYSVKNQAIIGQNQSFHLVAEEVNCEDGITEVWIRGRTISVLEPDGDDFLLYRYKRKN